MMKKKVWLLLLAAFLLSACDTGVSLERNDAPKAGITPPHLLTPTYQPTSEVKVTVIETATPTQLPQRKNCEAGMITLEGGQKIEYPSMTYGGMLSWRMPGGQMVVARCENSQVIVTMTLPVDLASATPTSRPTATLTQVPTPTGTPVPTSTAVPTATPTKVPQAVVYSGECPKTLAELLVLTQRMSKAELDALARKCNTQVSVAQAVPTPSSTQQMGDWQLQYFGGATPQMTGWKFENLVKSWDKFPNVDNPRFGFLARDGVEYGMAESAFGQLASRVDVNVPAMHYRLVTGEYDIPGVDTGTDVSGGVVGHGIMLINVGNVTAMFRNSMVDYGFTVEGRYWNGDAMPVTVRALLSHTAYNMLNQAGAVNPGANCSIPGGCTSVRLVFVILSGNEVLMKGVSFVSR